MITLLTPQDADFPGNPPPQESFLQAHFFKMLWCLWGLVMALLVGWLDRDVASALCWSAAAIMIGTVGSSIANRILGPYLQWFERFDRDEPLIRRLVRLKSEDLESENYKLLMEGYSDVHLRIAIPPLFGVFHGCL